MTNGSARHRRISPTGAAVVDKEVMRRIAIGGSDYTIAIDSEGIRCVVKGEKSPEVDVSWRDLIGR